MSAVRAMLTRAVVLATTVGLVSIAVAGATRGAPGAVGATLGLGLVLAFLLVGQVPVAQVAAGRRRLGAALLVLLYTTRVLMLLAAFRIVLGAGAEVDRRSLGLAVLASALGWTAGTVWSAVRWRPYVVGPEGHG